VLSEQLHSVVVAVAVASVSVWDSVPSVAHFPLPSALLLWQLASLLIAAVSVMLQVWVCDWRVVLW
jgi:hypothetical protein